MKPSAQTRRLILRHGLVAELNREFVPMAEIARLRSLQERHANLESRIADEGVRPRPDSQALARLKLQKLRLKEEMERLRPRAN